MKKAGFIFIISIFVSLFAFSQKIEYINDKADPLFGKIAVANDSLEIKKLFFAGLQEKLASNYPQAINRFEQVILIDPSNHASYFELANINFSQGNFSQSEQLIKKAIRFKPDNHWYWILLADIYKSTNKFSELASVLSEISKLIPKQKEYFYDRANAYLALGQVDKALDTYREIENKFGSTDEISSLRQRILLQNRKYDELVQLLNNQIVDSPQDIKNYIYLSEVLVKSGNRNKAIEVLLNAKSKFPSEAMIRLALADQFTALKQVENAFIELKAAFVEPNLDIDEKVRIVLSYFPMFNDMKARAYANELASIMVKVHPEEAKAFALLGDVQFQERKFQEAQVSYKRALEINDQVYQIWEQLLRIDLTLEDFDSLFADADKALTVFPAQANLYFYLGLGYYQVRNYNSAITYLNLALEHLPNDKEIVLQIYSSLGDSYNALKKFKESDLAYNQALSIDSNNSYVLNNYAYYLSLRGERLEDAEKMSKRSIEIEPNNPSFEDTYAWVLFKLKKYMEAKKWIEKSLQGKPENNATQREHFGDILYFLGDESGALEQWKNAKSQGAVSEKLNKKINEKRYID